MDSNRHWILFLIFSAVLVLCESYLATVEVEIDSFEVLDEKTISEGDCCDHGGSSNRCDMVFYIQNCSRIDTLYKCDTRVERFEGPTNNDSFAFPPRLRPATAFVVSSAPRELALNISVWDDDRGWSADDFVGNYILRLNPQMISKLEAIPGPQLHIITIPGHSRLTMYYRAYCNDFDCRRSPLRGFSFENLGGTFARRNDAPAAQEQRPGEQHLFNDAVISYGEKEPSGMQPPPRKLETKSNLEAVIKETQ